MPPTRDEPRIVSLLASATEIVFGLGLGKQLVGVSHECDFPAAAAQLPRVTRTLVAHTAPSGAIDSQVRELVSAGQPLYEIDVEQLAALRPDVIVTQAQCDVCAVRYADVVSAVESTPALNHAKIVSLNPYRLLDVFADIQRVADATGLSKAGRQWVARLRERVDIVARRAFPASPEARPRVACLEWLDPMMAAGNWIPELVVLAGGRYDLAEAGKHSGTLDWDALERYDPDVVLVSPCGFDLPRTVAESEILRAIPGFAQLSAVRRDRVFAVDGNAYFNRSGPRLVETIEIIAHLIDPDRNPAPTLPEDPKPIWQRLSLSS